MTTSTIEIQTKKLIDDLKATCASYGLGNDGNEYKIITQIFLYKFLNDKFGYEVKNVEEPNFHVRLKSAEKWEDALKDFTVEEYDDLLSFYLPIARSSNASILSAIYGTNSTRVISQPFLMLPWSILPITTPKSFR